MKFCTIDYVGKISEYADLDEIHLLGVARHRREIYASAREIFWVIFSSSRPQIEQLNQF
jgi:hypothetical protein